MRPLLVTCLLLLLSTSASAATFVVDPDGTGDFPNIQEAVDACVDGDIVQLVDGTYTGDGNRDIDFLGKAITVHSASGDPELCIIDCEGSETEPHQGFSFIQGESPASILQDVTVRGGWADSGGAGCFIDNASSPTVVNCIFEENTSRTHCGAIVVTEVGSEPEFTNCVFLRNDANTGSGGAGCIISGAQPTFTDCEFVENTATEHVGAIFVQESGSEATFENCKFERNTANLTTGGAWVGLVGSASFLNCDFTENVAAAAAGALAAGSSGEGVPCHLIVEGCTFTSNRAGTSSGAIGLNGFSSTTVTRSTFTLNTATEYGAAVGLSASASASLVECTLALNASPVSTIGLGSATASIALENTIVAFSTEGPAASGSENFTLSCSNVIGNTGGDYVGPIAGFLGLDGNMSANPLFCDIPARDLTLAEASPCATDNSGGCGLIGAWPVDCETATTAVADQGQVPLTRTLVQNYPNPFNPSTTIAYTLPASGRVTLTIHDVAGRLVRVLQSQTAVDAGRHETVWDGRDDRGHAVGSGVYHYRIDAGEWSDTRSMVLLK